MWKNGPIWSGGENFKRSISFAEFGVKIMPHVLFMQFEYPNWSGQMGWRPLMCYKFTMSSRLPRRLKHFIERADVDKREIQIQNLHTSWLLRTKTIMRSENQYHDKTTFLSTVRISKCMGLFRIESNVISRLSCLKELLVPKNCYSVEWIFIGPRSDHSLPMSVTDSLTESRPCWRFNELT